MTFSGDVLEAAHVHCSRHATELKASDVCGCFYCRSVFHPREIKDWVGELIDDLKEEDTALCPKCGIDSVIGSQSGYPVTSPDFLIEMHGYWFGRTVHVKN